MQSEQVSEGKAGDTVPCGQAFVAAMIVKLERVPVIDSLARSSYRGTGSGGLLPHVSTDRNSLSMWLLALGLMAPWTATSRGTSSPRRYFDSELIFVV